MSSIVLGVVLSFASVDGSSVWLTTVLSKTATASVHWDEQTYSSTQTSSLHRFGPLPLPRSVPITYSLTVANEKTAPVEVPPRAFSPGLRAAVYGDSRDGPSVQARLIEQIEPTHPDLLIETGDVVAHTLDGAAWQGLLEKIRPLSERVPIVAAIGNHELLVPLEAQTNIDPLSLALAVFPPPSDPLRDETGAPRSAYHLRLGGVLILVLDSNAPIGSGSPQEAFAGRVLASGTEAGLCLIILHHGPFSSGPHGGHPDLAWLEPKLASLGPSAVISGHDHAYERIERGSVTYIVSGGGGAPLYDRATRAQGSVAFASTYHWLEIDSGTRSSTITARSLEGALLDRIRIPPEHPTAVVAVQPQTPRIVAGLALTLIALLVVLVRLVLGRRLS